jgi:hypothetical protein
MEVLLNKIFRENNKIGCQKSRAIEEYSNGEIPTEDFFR